MNQKNAERPEVKARRSEREKQPHNRERKAIYNQEYKARPEVIERTKEYNKEYVRRPEVKERKKEYNEDMNSYNTLPEVKERRNERNRERYHTDILYRFRSLLSGLLNKKVRAIANDRLENKNTMAYLGCSLEEFKAYIESRFEEGMTWENYGRKEGVRCWELDHVVPAMYRETSSAEVTTEELIERSHYLNFQPLWGDENREKGNRFVGKPSRKVSC